MKKQLLTGFVISILFFVFVVGVLWIYADRNEKIENGELTLISESYMDD